MRHFAAILFGSLLGCVSAILPDHLIVLITLNIGRLSVAQGFYTGASWGGGHCLGILGVLLLCIPLKELQQGVASVGDYLVGLLLILVGLYFLVKEDQYLEDDGGTRLSCACHGPSIFQASQREKEEDGEDPGLCDLSGGQLYCAPCGPEGEGDSTGQATENTALLPASANQPQSEHTHVNLKGALIGLMQGVFCPSVALAVTLAESVHGGPLQVAVLAFSFVVSTIICNGMMGALVVLIARLGRQSSISRKVPYRCSCGVSVALGIAWIILEYNGMLSLLEFDESLPGHKKNL